MKNEKPWHVPFKQHNVNDVIMQCKISLQLFDTIAIGLWSLDVCDNIITRWLVFNTIPLLSENSDQPVHSHRLTRVFAMHSMGSRDPKYTSYGHLRLIILVRSSPKFNVHNCGDGVNDSKNGALTNSIDPDDLPQTISVSSGPVLFAMVGTFLEVVDNFESSMNQDMGAKSSKGVLEQMLPSYITPAKLLKLLFRTYFVCISTRNLLDLDRTIPYFGSIVDSGTLCYMTTEHRQLP